MKEQRQASTRKYLPSIDLDDLSRASGFKTSARNRVRRFVRMGRLVAEYAYDFSRYTAGSSSVNRGDSEAKQRALITMAYHSLEKGLSLPVVRPGFGVEHARTLILRLDTFLSDFIVDDNCRTALGVLDSYNEFNASSGHFNAEIAAATERLRGLVGEALEGGVRVVDRSSLDEFLECTDAKAFLESRSSVRQYTLKPVEREIVLEAVRVASRTPCVCNRQSWKVHVFDKNSDVADALRIQGGAAGFAEGVPTLLAVTSDLANFQAPGERHQCYIDGGLFAMSLMYALHAEGLVSCALNWSKGRKVDREFKERFSIHDSESIIMLLSVGWPRAEYRVANSARKRPTELVEFYEETSMSGESRQAKSVD